MLFEVALGLLSARWSLTREGIRPDMAADETNRRQNRQLTKAKGS